MFNLKSETQWKKRSGFWEIFKLRIGLGLRQIAWFPRALFERGRKAIQKAFGIRRGYRRNFLPLHPTYGRQSRESPNCCSYQSWICQSRIDLSVMKQQLRALVQVQNFTKPKELRFRLLGSPRLRKALARIFGWKGRKLKAFAEPCIPSYKSCFPESNPNVVFQWLVG
jgi:hypothetical protein